MHHSESFKEAYQNKLETVTSRSELVLKGYSSIIGSQEFLNQKVRKEKRRNVDESVMY